MSNLVILFIHFLATLARLLGPGGVRSIVAESLILKHQLLIVARSRQRSPNLCTSDRILAGLMALLVRPTRLLRSAIVLKPSTLLGLHKALSKQKYRVLFSPNRRRKPGPKGPSAELVRAVVEMKQRNPNWGCPRIAQQIALAFHIQIDKDVVRRILGHHYRPGQPSGAPSWLTFLGHMKDSLWSMDLFRCESATLRTHWVLVVMDQYTRRIIWFWRPCRKLRWCRSLCDVQPPSTTFPCPREGRTPDTPLSRAIANLPSFCWQPQCRGLYQPPMVAGPSGARAHCRIRSWRS